MSQSSVEFHKIWIEQWAATEDIREQFAMNNALDHLIGERLFTFVEAAEKDPGFAVELPAFSPGFSSSFPRMRFAPISTSKTPSASSLLPSQKVPLKLSARERELILEHIFADDELTAPLRVVPASGKAAVYAFTLDDLEELAGYVAAEANHATDKKLQKELDRLFARMGTVRESHADEKDGTTD